MGDIINRVRVDYHYTIGNDKKYGTVAAEATVLEYTDSPKIIMEKTASKETAKQGEYIQYMIVITNTTPKDIDIEFTECLSCHLCGAGSCEKQILVKAKSKVVLYYDTIVKKCTPIGTVICNRACARIVKKECYRCFFFKKKKCYPDHCVYYSNIVKTIVV